MAEARTAWMVTANHELVIDRAGPSVAVAFVVPILATPINGFRRERQTRASDPTRTTFPFFLATTRVQALRCGRQTSRLRPKARRVSKRRPA